MGPGCREVTVHKCHAKGCAEEVAPDRLFCARHWTMMPRGDQRNLLAHFTVGQVETPSLAIPDWYAALDAAIKCLAAAEGQIEELVGALPGQDPAGQEPVAP